MDVHPHAGAIRSLRDYLVHLSMVVLGILIALGLEQWQEARHRHEIARRALGDMLAEIRENRAEVAKAGAGLRELIAFVQKRLDLQEQAIEARRTHSKPSPEPKRETHEFGTPTLSSAAWDNALAMQALGSIDFETARKLGRIYSAQRDVKDIQHSFGLTATHLDTMAGRTLNDTPEHMREWYGAMREVETWMITLSLSYGHLLQAYDELVPQPAPAAAARP